MSADEAVVIWVAVLKDHAELMVRSLDAGSILVGRDASCDIRVNDPRMSRQHAMIEVQDDRKVIVKDMNSRNGLFLNGKRFKKECISEDVVIELADTYQLSVRFVRQGAGQPVAPSPAASPGTLPVATEVTASMVSAPPPAVQTSLSAQWSPGKVICPHCWHLFGAESLLAIARHQELLGDPVLGPEVPQRFLPSRFTPDGDAIDAHGLPCSDVACPRCHLQIPHLVTTKAPIFLSIVGAPASGKSYFLATMAWQLRNLMPRSFGFAFMDADATSNQIINEYERTLFLSSDDAQYVALEKTELQGRLYDQVRLDSMTVSLPRPFMFSLVAQGHHPSYETQRDSLGQTLVLYDNAGEHFEPGMDSAHNPGTQHLARAQGLLFIFDPTKDPRFRAVCRSDDPQLKPGNRAERQEILLTEAMTRLRKHAAQWRKTRFDKPLIILVTKYDIWKGLLGDHLSSPYKQGPDSAVAGVDMDVIRATSVQLRHLLLKLCPELVSTAESMASHVLYVPVSALGHSPSVDPQNPKSGYLMVQPKDIRPVWVTVPILYMLATMGLVPVVTRKLRKDLPVATVSRIVSERIHLTAPGASRPMDVPLNYQGCALRCPETGKWFVVPKVQPATGGRRSS